MLVVSPSVSIPDAELHLTFARSGGPGGQNVNKVESKVLLRWSVAETEALPHDVKHRFLQKFASRLTTEGDLLITSQRSRDQKKNIDDCLQKLGEMLLSALHKPKIRRPTKPTRGSKKRRLEAKRQHSQRKQNRRAHFHDD